jgi:lipopolysaccharide transport system permease protein
MSLSTAPASPSRLQLGLFDIWSSIKKSHVWLMLAYQDIRIRYRRSVLGPLWITLSMAITVFSMGFLYSHLFHNDLSTYFPFLTCGILTWSLIAALVTDATEGFIYSSGLIKQIKLPYSIYIHRIVWRNFIIFFHNLLVLIPIIIIFHDAMHLNLNSLLFIPHLLILYINAFCYGLIIAIICARYRDLPQLIKSLIQIVFFVTPVIWNPLSLPSQYQTLILCNPFYHFIELIRAPLTGQVLPLLGYTIVGATTLLGLSIAIILFSKYRARIVYWL